MNIHNPSLRRIAAFGIVGAMLIGTGCAPHTETQSSQAGGPVVIAPAAVPGATIGANNPPAGQPNHMSPEMEAQLQHYQALAGNKK